MPRRTKFTKDFGDKLAKLEVSDARAMSRLSVLETDDEEFGAIFRKNPGIALAAKAEEEILALAEQGGCDRILMTDNIMPHGYFSTLLPRLVRAERKVEIFYEQKANISRDRMALLRAAGVTSIQPGIESLSTDLLRLMRKGTSLRVNLDCLRHARAAGVAIAWNLLSDFPGDDSAAYEEMLAFLPALHHLEPPSGMGGLSIERFSPYFQAPEVYGITGIRPLPAYAEVFPGSDHSDLAYHFEAEYDSALRGDRGLKERLEAAISQWRAAWEGEPPLLHLFELGPDRNLLVDTRASIAAETRMIDYGEARLLLAGASAGAATPQVLDLVERQLLVAADGRYLPIACAALDAESWN